MAVYVVSGEFTDVRDNTPEITRSPGEHWVDDADIAHWGANRGQVPTVMFSVDVVPEVRAKAGRAKTTTTTVEGVSGASLKTPEEAPLEGGDIEERLTRLKGLYDKGLITKEEYDKKRGEILEAL